MGRLLACLGCVHVPRLPLFGGEHPDFASPEWGGGGGGGGGYTQILSMCDDVLLNYQKTQMLHISTQTQIGYF